MSVTGKRLQLALDRERHKVDVDHLDLPIRELLRMAVAGELVTVPQYQRRFRWDAKRESRLIESILLGLPVPSMFVATNEDATWELVDGLQRVTSIRRFVADDEDTLLTDHGGPLVLEGLEKLTEFNEVSFAEFPRPMQIAFLRRSLRVTALSDKSDYGVRFDLFERLNSGGVTLTEQEVRACTFRGPFIDMLRELSEYPEFQESVKLQPAHQNDGTREELVLKFFAYLWGRDSYDGRVKDFLNTFLEENRGRLDAELARRTFKEAVDILHEELGGEPLLRRGYGNTPLSQLEAVLVGIAELKHQEKRIRFPQDWQNDELLKKYSTKGTNTKSMLRNRIARTIKMLSGH